MVNPLSGDSKIRHFSFLPPVLPSRGIKTWQIVFGLGFFLWLVLLSLKLSGVIPREPIAEALWWLTAINFLIGILVIYGSCEALVEGADNLSLLLKWDSFIAGTVGEILTLLPELVIIFLLIRINPYLSFLIAIVCIYNNALAFSVYSFLLPKDLRGRYLMPESVTRAGTEVLIAGSGIALVLGLVMIALGLNTETAVLDEPDLLIVGIALLGIFLFYLHSLFKYYSHTSKLDETSAKFHSTEETGVGARRLVTWASTIFFLVIGAIGARIGGEAASSIGDALLNSFHLPLIPSALILAFFGSIDEYVVVFQAHRQKLMGIALSNIFGGITQVMFLVVPFTLILIAVSGLLGFVDGSIPINFVTTVVVILLFPVFFVLFEYLEEDHTLNNLDAAGMLGIFILILYVLLFMSWL